MAKHRFGYMEQFFSNEGLPLLDPNKDSDSENEDSTVLPEEPLAKPSGRADPANAVLACSIHKIGFIDGS